MPCQNLFYMLSSVAHEAVQQLGKWLGHCLIGRIEKVRALFANPLFVLSGNSIPPIGDILQPLTMFIAIKRG